MNSSKKAFVTLLAVGVLLTGLSGLIPLSGSSSFCRQDSEFKLYNDVKRGVPLVYYKSAEQCGDLACKFKPADPCQSNHKILRREFKALIFAADVGFWMLVLLGVRTLMKKGLK